MHMSGDYPGPSADVYGNVRALNTAFVGATSALKPPQQGRLCAVPFLLFSLREYDLAWWDAALDDDRQLDLMSSSAETGTLRLQVAALSFLWHLSRRNAYAVRIISGASLAWCERITALPLVKLLDRVGGRGDLMQSRLQPGNAIADRLLDSGISSRLAVQRAAQHAALQTLLTRAGVDDDRRMPAAACSMAGPVRVLEKKV